MDALRHLTARGNDNDNDNDNGGLNSSTVNLLISLLVLILLSITLVSSYLVIRRRRQKQQSELPLYQDHHHHNNSNNSRRQRGRGRRLTISASNRDSVFVIDEKRSGSPSSSSSSLSPPNSPVPEIRITFPEEEDAAGKRMSGRVVVVRISEKGGIGLEPLDEGREDGGRQRREEVDEDLPPYQRQPGGNGASTERFQSLDLERMGGLKEKEMDDKRWS